MTTRHEEYTTAAREANRTLWNAWLDLVAMQEEWNAQDYGNTMVLDEEGSNNTVTPAQVGAVIFDTANAIDTLVMDIGHATNITNLL